MERLAVTAIAVGFRANALLAREHPLAQAQRGVDLTRVAGPAYLRDPRFDGQRAYRSMSWLSLLSVA